MIDAETKVVIDELRAQQLNLQLKLTALESKHGKNKEDIDALADTRADLAEELEKLRAEIATKEAALKKPAAKSVPVAGITGIEDIDGLLDDKTHE